MTERVHSKVIPRKVMPLRLAVLEMREIRLNQDVLKCGQLDELIARRGQLVDRSELSSFRVLRKLKTFLRKMRKPFEND